MSISDVIKEKIEENHNNIVATRAYLHERPEVSSKEYETSKYLKERCKDLGLMVEDVEGSTGFTALLDTGKPGKTLGIRSDIDALAIKENPYNLKRKKKVISKNEGVSHACGHDSHMTISLVTAKILSELKEEISGKVYFIFEEAEETGAGIEKMVEHLRDKGLDAVYGNHQTPKIDSGYFNIVMGPLYAGCAGLEIEVIGEGGHGSRPDKVTNPLIAASHIVTNLNSAWNNQLDIEKPVTLGIGAIVGGSAPNVIPDRATIRGTLRFFDLDEAKKALTLVRNIATLVGEAHGCRVEFSDYNRVVAEEVVNDLDLADFTRNSLESIYPNRLIECEPSWGSESFYGYAKLAPSVYTQFGIRDEEFGSGSDSHTDKFDLDEKVIDYPIGLVTKFAIDFLKNNK